MRTLLVLAGCAGLLVAAVAVASGRIAIVSEDEAGQSWQPAPGQPVMTAGYPQAAPDKRRDVCVNIGFLIGTDGATSRFTEMKSWSSAEPHGDPAPERVQPCVQIAAAVVSRWKFVPVGRKPWSIYTSATFAFDGSRTTGPDAIKGRCRIADLADFVARAQARDSRRGGLLRSREESRRMTQD